MCGGIDEAVSEEFLKDFLGSKVREFAFNSAIYKFSYDTWVFIGQLLIGFKPFIRFRGERAKIAYSF
ncbi:hypothetical protein JOD02_002245 [Caldicoprobacter guelmensis]|nr:hypothetical protein [Caldicoprobacter guelmensis]